MRKLCINNGFRRNVIVPVVQVSVIVSLVLSLVCPVSCSMSDSGSETGVSIANGDYTAPVLSSYVLTGEKNIRLVFSKTVSVENLSLTPVVEIDSVSYEIQEDSQCCADVAFSAALEIGCAYALYGEAVDDAGNSLTFSVPFTGFNAEIPEIEIVRMRIKFQNEKNGDGKIYSEFVELRALSDGNLSGLELFSVSDGEGKKYVFPAVRVKKGEVVAVHLRNMGSGCIDELDDNLSLSSAFGSADGVRDLWAENTDSRLNDSADVVVLRNSFNGSLVDVVPYAKSGTESWKNDMFSAILDVASAQNLWSPDSSVSAAVKSDGTGTSKLLVKIQAGHSAGCWTVSNTESSYSVSGTGSENQNSSTETASPSDSDDDIQNIDGNDSSENDSGAQDGSGGDSTEDSTVPVDDGNIAELEITEIRPFYEGESNGNGKFYNEFVELRALSAGTLSGLEIVSVSDGEDKKYVFPSVMVSKGEIVVVHLRSAGEGCISELGDDLNASSSFDSVVNARDLWDENKKEARLHDTTDVVALRYSSDNSLVDAVPYVGNEIENWKTDSFAIMLETAVSEKLWMPDSSVHSAVKSDSSSAKRVFVKEKAGNSAGCWNAYVPSKSTPGIVDF